MKKTLLFAAACLLGMAAWAEIEFKTLPGPGKRFAVGADVTGVYEFNQKPQMGMVILKIQLFDKNGVQITPFEISGRSDMPSMAGAHDSGEVIFKVNSKKNYLLPVNVVMPGDWEVRLVFKLDGQPVFYGVVRFDV